MAGYWPSSSLRCCGRDELEFNKNAKSNKTNMQPPSTNRGMMGLKGDPAESISLPVAIVSPKTQTVRENQSATFYCSAGGNPKPTVTWTKVKGSLRNCASRDKNWTDFKIKG